jgi:hypothetical protein
MRRKRRHEELEGHEEKNQIVPSIKPQSTDIRSPRTAAHHDQKSNVFLRALRVLRGFL